MSALTDELRNMLAEAAPNPDHAIGWLLDRQESINLLDDLKDRADACDRIEEGLDLAYLLRRAYFRIGLLESQILLGDLT